MLLLLLFAVLAGAGTALSPCVLPVLPALLSAGATGGRRRPFGLALGLALTFTVTIVGLATVVDGAGYSDVPPGGRRAVGRRALPSCRSYSAWEPPRHLLLACATGRWLPVGMPGGALGFVYAPCAGPIRRRRHRQRRAHGRDRPAYAAAFRLPCSCAAGGRAWTACRRPRPRRPAVPAILIVTAWPDITSTGLETEIARHAPDLSSPLAWRSPAR